MQEDSNNPNRRILPSYILGWVMSIGCVLILILKSLDIFFQNSSSIFGTVVFYLTVYVALWGSVRRLIYYRIFRFRKQEQLLMRNESYVRRNTRSTLSFSSQKKAFRTFYILAGLYIITDIVIYYFAFEMQVELIKVSFAITGIGAVIVGGTIGRYLILGRQRKEYRKKELFYNEWLEFSKFDEKIELLTWDQYDASFFADKINDRLFKKKIRKLLTSLSLGIEKYINPQILVGLSKDDVEAFLFSMLSEDKKPFNSLINSYYAMWGQLPPYIQKTNPTSQHLPEVEENLSKAYIEFHEFIKSLRMIDGQSNNSYFVFKSKTVLDFIMNLALKIAPVIGFAVDFIIKSL